MGNNKKKREKKEKFISAVRQRKAGIVHLTHNDLDAAGCDAIHRRKYGENIFTIWSSVGGFTNNLKNVSETDGKGDILSISDIGYQKGIDRYVRKAVSKGWKIEWRDHHRWTDEEIKETEDLVEYLRVDTSVCATGIVAKDLMPEDKSSAEIAKVVCDYDLWRHNDPRSKILGEVCTKRKNLNYVRDRLSEGIIIDEEIEKIYSHIEKEKNEAIEKSIKKMKIYKGRYKIAFAPLYGYPSETAHAIRDRTGTDVEVIVSENGRFSIRSEPPISHLIAKEFNGGGHPPAAGGSFDFNFKDKMIFKLLKKSKYFKILSRKSENIIPED